MHGIAKFETTILRYWPLTSFLVKCTILSWVHRQSIKFLRHSHFFDVTIHQEDMN